MFTGSTLRRMFRRNTKKRTPVSRPMSRWNRYRLNLDLLEDRCVPALITVTSNGDDSTANNGNVTLREALVAINAGTSTNGDVTNTMSGTLGVNDSITFSGAMNINVGSQLTISRAVVILGLGEASTTITNTQAFGANSRIFDINVTSGKVAVNMSSMTLTGGNVSAGLGGAIKNSDESLTLTKMTFSNNTAQGQITTALGGSAAGGAIAMTGSGTLTIDSCTFTNNTASGTTTATSGSGGAIVLANAIKANIKNSTFDGNFSGVAGGVLQATGAGAWVGNPDAQCFHDCFRQLHDRRH